METAYIGLGGNVGDVVSAMAGALRMFDQHDQISVTDVSGVYKTPPWGLEDQDWFHNACARLQVDVEPEELLDQCLRIEQYFGRERRIRWGPRTLDLDVLLYGEQTIEEEHLRVPHPRMTEREFVLQPLVDIAPDVMLFRKTSTQWLAELESGNIERVDLPEDWWQVQR